MNFIDNASIKKETFLSVTINTERVLNSWKESVFSFEWIDETGQVKNTENLPDSAREKRKHVEELIRRGEPLEKPVLGIGLLEHIEIGSGKATFLTLAAHGKKEIPVHIPKSNADEFEPFII